MGLNVFLSKNKTANLIEANLTSITAHSIASVNSNLIATTDFYFCY